MRKVCWGLLLLAFGAGSAFAQEPQALPLEDAREIAVRQHPRITIAQLTALVAQQEVIATNAAFLPQVSGNVTAVGNTVSDARLASPGLAISSAPDRVSTGITMSQLVTDFGRTRSLTESSRFRAAAEESNSLATRAQLLLQVDTAYFSVLQAESVLRVAEETIKTRELILSQVRTLAANHLKSELDVSFAEANLQEGNLFLLQAQNNLSASRASLSTLLGYAQQQTFRLVEVPPPLPLTAGVDDLIAEALQRRPELARLRFECEAAVQTALAERRLRNPTVNLLGTVGANPARDETLLTEYYAVAGLTVTMPLLDGHRITARSSEAELRARQARETLRDEADNISLAVRVAWLDANNASKRLDMTAKLLRYSQQSLDLAQARYTAGASSFVELSQAQLSTTTAAIGYVTAKYDFLIRQAVLVFQIGRTK